MAEGERHVGAALVSVSDVPVYEQAVPWLAGKVTLEVFRTTDDDGAKVALGICAASLIERDGGESDLALRQEMESAIGGSLGRQVDGGSYALLRITADDQRYAAIFMGVAETILQQRNDGTPGA